VGELKLMKHLYLDVRQHERLLRVVEQRLGHALMARAEEAKIGVAAGGETMIDLNDVEEDLQIAFDADRLVAASVDDTARIVEAARETGAARGRRAARRRRAVFHRRLDRAGVSLQCAGRCVPGRAAGVRRSPRQRRDGARHSRAAPVRLNGTSRPRAAGGPAMLPRRAVPEKQKAPPKRGFSTRNIAPNLDRTDVRSLQTLRARLHFEFNLLVFLQRLEAFDADFREVREQIVAAAFRGDEAEALCVIEPLDGTGCHVTCS
jgi:hypothetical protein